MDAFPVPDFFASDANSIISSVAAQLQKATRDSSHPFRLFTLATMGSDEQPEARTVVLRRSDLLDRTLEIHTDFRSPKVAQLQENPRATCLFYDPYHRWQIRIRSLVSIHFRDQLTSNRWEMIPPASRQNYVSPFRAGEPIDFHLDTARSELSTLTEEEAYFAVLICRFDQIELYRLHQPEHQRIELIWSNSDWLKRRIAS